VAEEPPGRSGVPPVLDQDVEHGAILVDGPSQVLPLSVDLHEDFVQVLPNADVKPRLWLGV
jgi:hypothetical protein